MQADSAIDAGAGSVVRDAGDPTSWSVALDNPSFELTSEGPGPLLPNVSGTVRIDPWYVCDVGASALEETEGQGADAGVSDTQVLPSDGSTFVALHYSAVFGVPLLGQELYPPLVSGRLYHLQVDIRVAWGAPPAEDAAANPFQVSLFGGPQACGDELREQLVPFRNVSVEAGWQTLCFSFRAKAKSLAFLTLELRPETEGVPSGTRVFLDNVRSGMPCEEKVSRRLRRGLR